MTRLLFLALLFASPAFADGLYVAPSITQGGSWTGVVVIPLGKETPQSVLVVCGMAVAGKSDLNNCGTREWKLRSDIQPTDLVGYCIGAETRELCTIDKGGGEGWKRALDIWPVTPSPPAAPGTVGMTLTWTAVTTWSNGTALTTLAGYRVYLNGSVVAELGKVTQWLTSAPGEYAITSFTSDGLGLESVKSSTVTVVVAPPIPFDCKVSPWMSGTASPWTPEVCATGTQTRSIPQTRVVVTPAANGGAACPALAQTISETQACIVPAPVDVCKADPIPLTVRSWPGGASGSRVLAWDTGTKVITSVTWTVSPLKVTVTDKRGCSASVTR